MLQIGKARWVARLDGRQYKGSHEGVQSVVRMPNRYVNSLVTGEFVNDRQCHDKLRPSNPRHRFQTCIDW